jgi:hypothetical protein
MRDKLCARRRVFLEFRLEAQKDEAQFNSTPRESLADRRSSPPIPYGIIEIASEPLWDAILHVCSIISAEMSGDPGEQFPSCSSPN